MPISPTPKDGFLKAGDVFQATLGYRHEDKRGSFVLLVQSLQVCCEIYNIHNSQPAILRSSACSLDIFPGRSVGLA